VSEKVLTLQPLAGETHRPSPLDRWARKLVRTRLAGLRAGSLKLVDRGEIEHYGRNDAALRATVYVEDPRFYRTLALRGSLGGAEAYIDGHWQTDDLTAVVRILAVDQQALTGLDLGVTRLIRPSLALVHALRRNTRAGSRRNIAAHYDLGNDFFELFLDPTLTYSSGIFESEDVSMEQASIAKNERICRKLRIGPEDHVLEIGTGWGGFALHAASRHGCRVTTTTISRRQQELACRRVSEAGLADRIDVWLEDYRDLRGSYDKLVSIEMIEAVGHAHLERFFRTCGERLRHDGAMLLQAITIPDQDYRAHKRSVDFIKRYIFPGGELVSVGAANGAAARASDLRLSHLEDLTPHYAETLRRWRRRMYENLPRMRAMGLADRFLRMWEFYLCYCEGGFEERQIGVVQALFEKPGARREPVLGRMA
jgi:cyclopropane-fatty-acyl-phospholipid synthase